MNTISFVQLKQVVISETQFDSVQLTSTTAVAEFARDYIGDNDRETLIVIGINTKSAINFISIASIGSLNEIGRASCRERV